jgi:hypothetical protein
LDGGILVERRQQVHQAFDGETRQRVVTKCRDLRLRDSQDLGGIRLRELTRIKYLIQRIGQAQGWTASAAKGIFDEATYPILR